MRRCVGTVRTHHVMWALIFSLLPSHVHLFISAALLDRSGPDRLYAYSYARLVPHLTCGLHRICGWRVSVSLILVDMTFATEGPEQGVKRQLVNPCCGCKFVGKEAVFSRKP